MTCVSIWCQWDTEVLQLFRFSETLPSLGYLSHSHTRTHTYLSLSSFHTLTSYAFIDPYLKYYLLILISTHTLTHTLCCLMCFHHTKTTCAVEGGGEYRAWPPELLTYVVICNTSAADSYQWVQPSNCDSLVPKSPNQAPEELWAP